MTQGAVLPGSHSPLEEVEHTTCNEQVAYPCELGVQFGKPPFECDDLGARIGNIPLCCRPDARGLVVRRRDELLGIGRGRLERDPTVGGVSDLVIAGLARVPAAWAASHG